jgi:hypothetical protein
MHKSSFPTDCVIGFNAVTCFGCELQPSSVTISFEDLKYSMLYMLSYINSKIFIHPSVILKMYSIIKIVLNL